jgi:hypothetical protein
MLDGILFDKQLDNSHGASSGLLFDKQRSSS